MDWNAFAQDVHRNAVEHGFWEGERPREEIFALIHSEWSEALEEYRAGRPMVWYDEERGHKPEGIAVELVDGCIRILDLLAEEQTRISRREYTEIDISQERVVSLIGDIQIDFLYMLCLLHIVTSRSAEIEMVLDCSGHWFAWLFDALSLVYVYLRQNGIDLDALMREKHEYNKTRPYKHGKKC